MLTKKQIPSSLKVPPPKMKRKSVDANRKSRSVDANTMVATLLQKVIGDAVKK